MAAAASEHRKGWAGAFDKPTGCFGKMDAPRPITDFVRRRTNNWVKCSRWLLRNGFAANDK